MKTIQNLICPAFALFAFACFALSPAVGALNPPPDGGYPNFTTAEGTNALLHLSTGANNTAIGFASLGFVTTGNLNTGLGAGTLLFTNGDGNTAAGAGALLNNSSGSRNTAVGSAALSNNTTGSFNIAVGQDALLSNGMGGFNTAIGFEAGSFQTSGASNVYIGAGMHGVAGQSNACYIASIFGQTIDPATATLVAIDANSKLGTVSSSKRFKEDIKPMDKASEALLALKPVTFHYKSDAKNTPCFGLIAEEVAEVNPDLIVRDKDGEIYSVRYDAVNAMLLNEFLKEHRTVQELKKQVAALTAGLQKVSAQLELSKVAPQTVAGNQ